MIGEAYDVLRIMGGHRAADLRRAIACFEAALTVLTPEAAPTDYGIAQMGLGNAYVMLPEGDRVADLRRAIACFEAALTVFTPEAASTDYGMAQMGLGNAYGYKYKSPMDRMMLKGPFHSLPIDVALFGSREQNLRFAIVHFGLMEDRVANLRRIITCYEGDLHFQTRRSLFSPALAYAMIQLKLGLAYAELPVGDRADNLRRAIACFEAALTVFTVESDPDLYRAIAHNLGSFYFDECQWDQARAFYAMAIAATEALYQLAATEDDRQAELAEAWAPFSNLAYCLARLGKPNEAIERLEVGKARGLAKALARDRAALDCVEAEDRAAFEAVCSRIKSLEVEFSLEVGFREMRPARGSDRTTSRSFEIFDELRAAHHERDSVINRIHAYQPEFMPPGFDFRAIAATVVPECPLVYLITTSQGSLALIVPPKTKTLDTNHVVWLNEFRSDDLNGLLVQRDDAGEAIGGYLVGQMMGEYQQLKAGLDLALPILRDRLMGPLAARLMELGLYLVTGSLAAAL